jgi:hypothetical protein
MLGVDGSGQKGREGKSRMGKVEWHLEIDEMNCIQVCIRNTLVNVSVFVV